MDPAFETRLLDTGFRPLIDNADGLFRQKAPTGPIATLRPMLVYPERPKSKRREATFTTDGRSRYLLAFDFGDRVQGDVALLGSTLNRSYTLPQFGEARSFGRGPESTHLLPLSLPSGQPEKITLRTEIPRLTAKVYAFQPDDLPIRTNSLIPLSLSVTAPEAAFVETPRVFIPGYRAAVDGVTTAVVRSPQGLVSVLIPAGRSEVVVSYVGPMKLRLSFWFSLCGLPLLALFAMWAWRRAGPLTGEPTAHPKPQLGAPA